jgi:hypothetical protein
MLSSEHSPLQQRALVQVVAAAVAAVADAVVAAQQVEQQRAEPQQPQQAEQSRLPERQQQTRAVDVVLAVAADAVLVAVTLFPRFVDPRLNRGFHSSRGLQPSTITTRLTR